MFGRFETFCNRIVSVSLEENFYSVLFQKFVVSCMLVVIDGILGKRKLPATCMSFVDGQEKYGILPLCYVEI